MLHVNVHSHVYNPGVFPHLQAHKVFVIDCNLYLNSLPPHTPVVSNSYQSNI